MKGSVVCAVTIFILCRVDLILGVDLEKPGGGGGGGLQLKHALGVGSYTLEYRYTLVKSQKMSM